jgi:hypothetical protein
LILSKKIFSSDPVLLSPLSLSLFFEQGQCLFGFGVAGDDFEDLAEGGDGGGGVAFPGLDPAHEEEGFDVVGVEGDGTGDVFLGAKAVEGFEEAQNPGPPPPSSLPPLLFS